MTAHLVPDQKCQIRTGRAKLHGIDMTWKCGAVALVVGVFGAVVASCGQAPPSNDTKASAAVRPNIVLIIADDLGYSDIGVFGAEIATPNLDKLAASGVMLTNFHANASCTPSRAMLLTGMDNHAVGFGANSGLAKRVPALQHMPGYTGEFGSDTISIATRLQSAGYRTLLSGKWHLGANKASFPPAQGYDQSFFLEHGGASHFSDGRGNLSRSPKAHYWEGTQKLNALPEGFFSTVGYTSKAIEYLDDPIAAGTPFFLHLAYTAPHWPLQAPDDWIDKYSGQYDQGWAVIRAARIEKMTTLGLLPDGFEPSSLPQVVGDWDDLLDTEQKREARTMELHAAMISQLDHEIGRLIDHLKARDVYDNTIVVFLSDNGPEGNNVPGIGDGETWIPENFDQSLQNMGRPNSYVWLGRAWAHVSAGAFRNYKTYLNEGGVRVPAIVSFPGGLEGMRIDDFVSITDIAPTLLEAAGVNPRFNQNMHGTSILNSLMQLSPIAEREVAVAFEIYGARAVYKEQWKLIWSWSAPGNGKWALYNLATDPTEQVDLAPQNPDLVEQLSAAWSDYAELNGVYMFDQDMGYGRYPDQSQGSE